MRESIDRVATNAAPVTVERAWELLLHLVAQVRAGKPATGPTAFAHGGAGWAEVAPRDAQVHVDPRHGHAWLALTDREPDASRVLALLDLFLPLVAGPVAADMVVGHLGQSLDGRVATPTGASQFITGRDDVVHTHRLRALFDAVVVGVRTVEADDPYLTTRLVPGNHPVRVVLDPNGKLSGGYKVLEDGTVETCVVTTPANLPAVPRRGATTWVALEATNGCFEIPALLATLRGRGLRRIFVEGGGVTISRFLTAGRLHRLHVGVAPVILGSGAPSFALPAIDKLEEAMRFRWRHVSLGTDVLFDCDLTPAG